jgi:archaetidylinositol phosphate synthase
MNRIHHSLTGRAERQMLDWICPRLPDWITSDMLTLLGLSGALLSFCGYWLSGTDRAWLWLAIAGLVLNWLGDSLDGSLARYRRAERPNYGFFLDHMTDTLAIALIAIGAGLSPFVLLASGFAVLAAYFSVVILSMVTCIATGVFRISFGGIGPTEIRLIIALCTLAGLHLPIPGIHFAGEWLTIYDFLMLAVAALLVLTCAVQFFVTLKQLAVADPPKQRQDGY